MKKIFACLILVSFLAIAAYADVGVNGNRGIFVNGVDESRNTLVGDVTVSGTLEVAGVVTLNSDLDVTGSAGLDGDIVYQTDKYVVVSTFTAAGINAAIDALGADGGEVYLPEGTYVMTDGTITIDYDNTTLTGAGASTILDWSAGQANHGIDLSTKNGCTIQNISFLGYGATGGDAGNFINGTTCSNTKILNCYFSYGDDNCIFISGAWVDNLVEGCTFDNVDGRGVLLDTGAYGRILNNYFDTGFVGGAAGVGGPNSVVSGNTFKDVTKGIYINGGTVQGTISDNAFQGCTSYPIDARYGSNSVISGNTIEDTATGYADIYVRGDYYTITGNVCDGSSTSDIGIWLDDADYCVVSGNITQKHDVAGIQEDADCQGNIIYGNNCQDTVRSIINGTLHEKLDEPVSLVDGTGIYTLRDAKAGWGIVTANDGTTYANFFFTTGGVVTLGTQNNCTTTQNNDTTLNIYDSGTAVVIENELGDTYKVQTDIHYID